MNLPVIKDQQYLKCCYNCQHFYEDYDSIDFCTFGVNAPDQIRRTSAISICDEFKQVIYK